MNTALKQADRPLKVFLSHAHADRGYAERVRRILVQSIGAQVFSDEMLSAGDRWYERLLQEVREAAIFVVIGTPRSSVSESVLQELGAAWATGKPLVIVTAEEGMTWHAPVESRKIEQISLPELERPGGVERLFARLSRPKAEGADHH